MLKIAPPFLWILCVILILAVSQIFSSGIVTPFFVKLLGASLFLGGIWLGFATVRKFIRLNTEVHTFRDASTLSTDGLFRFSRNPVYLGQTLALIGLALALGSPLSLIFAAVFCAACNFHYIPFEEKNLDRIFESKYRDYKRKVRRWI